MFKKAALALLLLLAAGYSRAADLQDCATQSAAAGATRSYLMAPDEECYLLCQGIGTATGTTCTGSLPKDAFTDLDQFTVGIGNANTICATGNIAIAWCATTNCDAPGVSQTFATLTGAGSTDTSSLVFPYHFGRTYRATYSIADTDCNNNGGVDVFIKIRKRKSH